MRNTDPGPGRADEPPLPPLPEVAICLATESRSPERWQGADPTALGAESLTRTLVRSSSLWCHLGFMSSSSTDLF